MKAKISLIVSFFILVLPVTFYALLNAPNSSSAIAQNFGKPEVIEFYTPLCSECQKLKKALDKVEPKYSKDVAFTKIDASLPNETDMEQIKKYHIRVVPTTVFLDKKGNIDSRIEGSIPEETLNTKLKELTK